MLPTATPFLMMDIFAGANTVQLRPRVQFHTKTSEYGITTPSNNSTTSEKEKKLIKKPTNLYTYKYAYSV